MGAGRVCAMRQEARVSMLRRPRCATRACAVRDARASHYYADDIIY